MPTPDSNIPPPRRPSRTLRGWVLRGATVGLGMALAVWIVIQNSNLLERSSRPARPPDEAAASPIAGHDRAQHAPDQASASAAARTLAPAPLRSSQETPRNLLQQIEPCVVRIEADGPGGLTVVGSGFVVDSQGLVATSFHVTREFTQGVARFRDGTVYEIAGYVALDPQRDLAILQLRGAANLTAARLSQAEPQPLDAVVAIGHPQGVEFSPFDGKISRLVTTDELPAATHKFVRDLTTSERNDSVGGLRNHQWIQHTANLSDGNSGGPLVAESGAVIGINTWVDRQSGFGYALPVTEIAALLDDPLPEMDLLDRHATSAARLRAQLWQTSAEELKRLEGEARAMRWQPTTRREYARLQQLAFGITLANEPQHFGGRPALGERFDDLVKAADRIVARLRQEKWSDAGQILLLNEFAATEVLRPQAGLIFVGTIEKIVTGPQDARAAIVVLAGFEQRLLVPLESNLSAPEAGAQCLIVGVNDRGRTVQYGDNPLNPIVAPVVVAPVVIVLGK